MNESITRVRRLAGAFLLILVGRSGGGGHLGNSWLGHGRITSFGILSESLMPRGILNYRKRIWFRNLIMLCIRSNECFCQWTKASLELDVLLVLFCWFLLAVLEAAAILAIADWAMGGSPALGFFRGAWCCVAFSITAKGFDFGIILLVHFLLSGNCIACITHHRDKGCPSLGFLCGLYSKITIKNKNKLAHTTLASFYRSLDQSV